MNGYRVQTKKKRFITAAAKYEELIGIKKHGRATQLKISGLVKLETEVADTRYRCRHAKDNVDDHNTGL